MTRLPLLAAALVMGCGKAAPPAGDAKDPRPAAGGPTGTASPAATTPPKPAEPPRLAPAHKFKTGIREINRLAVTDDGTRLAVAPASYENKAATEVWDLAAEPKKVRDLAGSFRALSPDGKLLTRGHDPSGGTEVVDVATGAPVCLIPDVGELHAFTGPERVVMVRPGEAPPGGKSVALRVRLYDARTGGPASGFEVPSPSYARVFGPVNDRRELVVWWEAANRFEVWDLAAGKLVRGVTLPDAPAGGSMTGFAASPDGKRVMAPRQGGTPGVYDTATGAQVGTALSATESVFVPGREVILGHTHWSDAKYQSYGGWRAYDLGKNAVVADLPGTYLFPAITPDGRVLVTRVDRTDPHLLVWDLSRIP